MSRLERLAVSGQRGGVLTALIIASLCPVIGEPAGACVRMAAGTSPSSIGPGRERFEFVIGQQRPTRGEQEEMYPLPADPEQIVLSLSYGGGLPLPQQQRFTPTPMVRVTAAGKVITGGSSPRAPVVEMQLSQAELQQLLRELIERDHLFELRPGEIDAAIKETGQPIMIADAPATTITVHLLERTQELKQYASRMIKQQYPQIKALQQFVSAENRLRRLHGTALLGGQEEMLTMLAAVNEAIGAKSADLPMMSPESLEFVSRDAQGKLTVTWIQEVERASNLASLSVRVEVDGTGRRNIQVGELREKAR